MSSANGRPTATGQGRVAFSSPRPALDDDFGRKLVSFGVIGALSTIASLLLFLMLRTSLDAIGANAVAVTATFAANTWLNARYTARVGRPRWRRACAIYAGALLLTTAALAVAGSLGANRTAELVTLGLTWTLASIARFLFLGRTLPTRTSR